MEIEHLALFVRLSVTQNISRAGEELGLSPAVASAYLRKLEAGLGVRLVHRTTRSVSLTEDGISFLPHAQEVLASVAAARASVGLGKGRPTGTLRVTASASFGRLHLMPFLKGFLDLYPELEIDLRFTDTIVDLVRGGFDVAIRNASEPDAALIARKLAPDRRILCASPAYLARFGEPSHPADLSQHEFVTLTSLGMLHFETPEGRLPIHVRGRFRTDNGAAVRDACAAGMGIAMSSTWNVYQELQRGELVEVLSRFPLVTDTAIWAVYPSARLLAPKIKVFIDYYLARFGHPPYWDIRKTA